VDGTNLVRCKWEEQNPGHDCPACIDGIVGDAALDSVLHIDEVIALLELRSATAVCDALEAFGIVVPMSTIRSWDTDQRAEVKAWAEFDQASTDAAPARPAVLGTCHVAGEVLVVGDPQTCTQCDAVLIAATEDGSEPNYYAEGILVSTDCPGKAKADGQHYIGGQRKSKGRKKKTDADEAAE
jgi:hypothetical protein